MESSNSKPTNQDMSGDRVTVKNISERTTAGGHPVTVITSSSSLSSTRMDLASVPMLPSKCDQGIQSSRETPTLASSHSNADAEKLPVSRSTGVPGFTTEPARSLVGSIAFGASKETAVPLVLIKQGSPSEKLLVYAHPTTGPNYQGSMPLNLKKAPVSQSDAKSAEKVTGVTLSVSKGTAEAGGHGKPSGLDPPNSNSEDAMLAIQTKGQSKEVPASTKNSDECFLGQLGLKKVEERLQASSKTEDAVQLEESGRGVDQHKVSDKNGSRDRSVSKEESLKDQEAQIKDSPGQVSRPQILQDKLSKLFPAASAKVPTIKVISPVISGNSLTEIDIPGLRSKEGQASGVSISNAAAVPGKNTPIYIKVKLEEKDVTIICCPVALLLQHKEVLEVSLQTNNPNGYSIRCRKCSYEVSEPYTMLQHLKAQHQIQGCLQKLLNLNSQHLGCMNKPVCVNIPGVLTLPDGLSDMEQGVIRFNSMGIPRLSFVCRLCPLNFHTARGLSSHHQYFMRNIYNKGQHSLSNSRWFCRLCPRQFCSFLDYYEHHRWMRVAKDLFHNTEQISKKKFQVMDESGKVVASLEVPKSQGINTWPDADSDSEYFGWGRKPRLLDDGSPLGIICGTSEQAFDSGNPTRFYSSAFRSGQSTQDGTNSKQQTEVEKEKKTAPPLFQTLDSLCRRLALQADSSSNSLDKLVSVGDKQVDDDHEYMCGICHKTFPRLPQMQGHMGSHVRKRRTIKSAPPAPATVPSPPADPPFIEPPSAVDPVDVEFKCGVCHKTFPKLDQMRIHSECHNRLYPSEGKPMKSLNTPFLETVKLVSFTCDICQWSFPSERKLWDHRSTHSQKKIDEVTQSVSSKASGYVRKKTLFVCVYCRKSFARQVNLKFHLKKHSTEKIPQGSNFPSTRTIVKGKDRAVAGKVTAGDKPDSEFPLDCSLCSRRFHSIRQLRSHKTWHTKVQKVTEVPRISLIEASRASKNPYTCNKCNKDCSSYWELQDHNREHATPRRVLVRHSYDESRVTRTRRILPKPSTEKKTQEVSDAGTSRGSVRPKREGLFKYFCRHCHNYFQSSQQFARHMAKHSNSSNSRSSSDSSSGRPRRSKITQESMGKQKEMVESGDDSSDGTDVSRSMSPDDQPPDLDQVSPGKVEKLPEKDISEGNEKSEIEGYSSLVAEGSSQSLKEFVTGEQIPQASDTSTEEKLMDSISSTACRDVKSEMENTSKQNSSGENLSQTTNESDVPKLEACHVDSKVSRETSPVLVATNQDTESMKTMTESGEGNKVKHFLILQDTGSTVETLTCSAKGKSPAEVISEDVREIAGNSGPTTPAQACDNTIVVAAEMSQKAGPSMPNKQPSEVCKAFSLVDGQSLENGTLDNFTQNRDSDNSPAVMENYVPSTNEPLLGETSYITVQTTITGDLSIGVEETKPEVGSSPTSAYSCRSPSSDDENVETRPVLTEKQNDQLPDCPMQIGDSSPKIETGRHETKPSIADEPLLLKVAESQQSQPLSLDTSPSLISNVQLNERSSTLNDSGSQPTSPVTHNPPLLVSSKDTCTKANVESQDTRPLVYDTPPSVSIDEGPIAVMATKSPETRASTPDAPPILSCEVYPQSSNVPTLEESCANPDSSSSAVLEDTSMPMILNTPELQRSDVETSWLKTSSRSSQKQDCELLKDSVDSESVQSCKVPAADFSRPHSAVMKVSLALQEDKNQGTKPSFFEAQAQENEIGQLETSKEPKQQLDAEVQGKPQLSNDVKNPTDEVLALSQRAEPEDVDDSVAVDGRRETEPLTCDVKPLEGFKAYTVKGDGKSTDYSAASDTPGGAVRMTTTHEASSSDALFAEDTMGQSHTSELPGQKPDKLTAKCKGGMMEEENLGSTLQLGTPESLPQKSSTSTEVPKDVELAKATVHDNDSAMTRANRDTRPSIFEALTQNVAEPSKAPEQLAEAAISTPPEAAPDVANSLLEDTGERVGPDEVPHEERERYAFPRTVRYSCDICSKSFPKKVQLRGHKVAHARQRLFEDCEDEPAKLTSIKDTELNKDDPPSSLPMEEDVSQEKDANDLPTNSTESVDQVAEVISVNQMIPRTCDSQMTRNLQSDDCPTHVSEEPSQQCHQDSKVKSHSAALPGSVGEARKTESDADIEKQSQDKASTVHSTTCKKEDDKSLKVRPAVSNSKRNNRGQKLYRCPHCEKTYTRINQLNAHQRIHMRTSRLHPSKKGSTDVLNRGVRKGYKCTICHAVFYNYKKFCGHRGAHISHKRAQFKKYSSGSPEESNKESSDSKVKEAEPKATDSPSAVGSKKPAGKFTCQFCPETFQIVAQLRNHIMATHPIPQGKPFLLKPFTCELCGKAFSKSKQRLLHMRLHGKKRRRRRGIKRLTSLQDTDHSYYKKLPAKHGGTETANPDVEAPKEKAFNCEVCDKPFKNQEEVAAHMKTHKEYRCKLCPASFTLARQLCGHLKLHGGLQKKREESPSSDSEKHSSGLNVSQGSPLSTASQQETHITASSQSSALLKGVIKVFLSCPKTKKRHPKGRAGKWLQPKSSLQRALMKHQQNQMQNVIGILRKSIVLEIDADSHRLVYECTGCQKIAYCHKNILRHYLEKHLQSTEGMQGVEQVASTSREDAFPAPNPRFRNKSKIGCPICKGSSGFQCHLHNEEDLIAIDTLLRHDEDDNEEVFASDSSDANFSSRSKLVQHRQDHAKRQPSEPFKCTQCPFQAKGNQSLKDHMQIHTEKSKETPSKEEPDGEKMISCPQCSFKVKNVYALAAHSRIHKGKGKRRPLEAEKQTPPPSPSPSPSPSAEVSPVSSDGAKHRKNAYNCFACPKYFYTAKAYQKHMKSHEQLFQFKCSVCSFSFLSLGMLDEHLKSAHSIKLPYTCSECSFSSHSFTAIQGHIRAHSEAREKKERQASWSAYLKAVLQLKGPEVASALQAEKVAEYASHPSGVSSYNSQVHNLNMLEESSNLHPVQDGKLTTYVKQKQPNVKETQNAMDIETLSVNKQTENSPVRQSDSPDEYFACSQCKDFRASTKEDWDNHIASVHSGGSESRKLRCSMCQYATISHERLEQHMKLHRHQTLQCNNCTYRTPMRHLMIRHVQTVHRQHRPFKCKLCTYATAYRHHLRRHAEKHKNPNFRCRYRKLMQKGDWQTSEASSRIICKDCGRELRTKKTLRNHLIKVHGKLPGGKNPQHVQEDSNSSEMGYALAYSIVVQDPTPAQMAEKRYECSVCSFKFKRRSDLNQHMAEGHAEAKASLPCQCPQCGLVTGSGQLQHHMLIHQEENLFQCEEEGCNFQTAQEVHLQRHRNKHAAERDVLVTCRYCQVKFPDVNSLQVHNAKVHSEQTNTIGTRSPFLCSLCPFTSTNEKDANRHFSLHNYNLAFKCEYCVFSSSTASAIATHQKIHKYPRRNLSTAVVSKKASQQQRQKMTSSTVAKSADNQNGQVTSAFPERPHPKHVFVSNKGKKLYECRYCQRFFDVAEAWQRHELRHMTEWPQY